MSATKPHTWVAFRSMGWCSCGWPSPQSRLMTIYGHWLEHAARVKARGGKVAA